MLIAVHLVNWWIDDQTSIKLPLNCPQTLIFLGDLTPPKPKNPRNVVKRHEASPMTVAGLVPGDHRRPQVSDVSKVQGIACDLPSAQL